MKTPPPTRRQISTPRRFLRFSLVGMIGTALQLALLAALTKFFLLDYLLATVIAVELTIMHNFAWHERFTWRERGCPIQPGSPARARCAQRAAPTEAARDGVEALFWLEWGSSSAVKIQPFRQLLRRFLQLNLSTGMISIVGNVMLMKLLVDAARLDVLLANLVSVGACSLLNFAVGDRLIFRAASG